MSRDISAQIIELKARHESDSPRFKQYVSRKNSINCVHHFLDSVDADEVDEKGRVECMRYIPIAVVACIQGYFRFAFRDLIDHGPPFSVNANKIKQVRYDTDSILALSRQHITAGEFISHFIPCNSLDDINHAATMLCGTDFRTAAKLALTANALSGMDPLKVFPMVFRVIDAGFVKRNIFLSRASTERDTFTEGAKNPYKRHECSRNCLGTPLFERIEEWYQRGTGMKDAQGSRRYR